MGLYMGRLYSHWGCAVKRLRIGELRELRDAINKELEARERQLNILADALEQLQGVGADDPVIEGLLASMDALDQGGTTDPHVEAVEVDARKAAITELRAMGYSGPGLDALIAAYHRDIVEQEWSQAEAATCGHMTKPQYAGKYNTRRFWNCPMRELRKRASDELLTWFDTNGRTTRAMLRDQLLSGKHYAGSGYINNR